jgi:hypothetical protein
VPFRRIPRPPLARSLLIRAQRKTNGGSMRSKEALKSMLKQHLMYRGLRAVQGRLAFSYKGEIVELDVNESLYRGTYIAIVERGRAVREFRAHDGEYDWNAIAVTVMEVAEARNPRMRHARPAGLDAINHKLASDLRSMVGPEATSHLSIEPSTATPGRVRVRVDEVELEPAAVLQLFAALSRVLPRTTTPYPTPAI